MFSNVQEDPIDTHQGMLFEDSMEVANMEMGSSPESEEYIQLAEESSELRLSDNTD